MSEFESDEYYRVTEVLATYAKLDQIPPHILGKACERGTEVHKICIAILQDIGIPEIPEEYLGYIDSFMNWKSKLPNNCKFVFPDRFFNDYLLITGECDFIINIDEKNILFDIKTSANESKTWPLQGAAYAYMCGENNIEIDEIRFIKIYKDGSDAKVLKYDYNPYIGLFRQALDVHKYFNPKKKKNGYRKTKQKDDSCINCESLQLQ